MSEKNSKLVLRIPPRVGTVSNSSPVVANVPRAHRNDFISGILEFKMEGDRIPLGAVCVFCLKDRVLKKCISGVVFVEMAEKWLFALSVKQIQYAPSASILISKMWISTRCHLNALHVLPSEKMLENTYVVLNKYVLSNSSNFRYSLLFFPEMLQPDNVGLLFLRHQSQLFPYI
jgi:hypothetical protein